jgi:DNA polymerase-1
VWPVSAHGGGVKMLIKVKRKFPSNKVSVDTETNGLNTFIGARPYIVSWCFYDAAETTGFFHWPVDPFTRKVTPNPKDVAFLKTFLEDPAITKVFHNAKFDRRMLETLGIVLQGRIEDTSLRLRCLHNDLPTYSLKPVCKRILGFDDEELKTLKKACMKARHAGKKLGWKLADDIEPDYWMVEDHALVDKYAVYDVLRTKRLDQWMDEQMKDDDQNVIYEKELKLLPVVYEMETRGASINPAVLCEEIAYHTKFSAEQLAIVHKLSGSKEFNLKSPKQLSALMYDKLGLECKTFTDSGERSVNSKALKGMKHPIALALCSYKASQHAMANFFSMYTNEAERRTDTLWVMHPNFMQMGARTARFACSKPNLQNVSNGIAYKSLVSIQARRPFGPAPGYTWYSVDHSQMEVRVFASLSGEQLMIDALNNNRDLHTEVANMIWGHGKDIVAEEIAKTSSPGKEGKSPTRIRAKILLFGIIYGIGPRSAMELVGCTYAEAVRYLDDFKAAFPQMARFMKDFSRKAESQGYILNAYGRRYFIEADKSYVSVNYLVQGSCADMLKEQMIETNALFHRLKIDGGIIMTIHDELMFEINNKHISKNLLLQIKNIMENHHGKFPQFKKLKVEFSRITEGWNKKEKLEL